MYIPRQYDDIPLSIYHCYQVLLRLSENYPVEMTPSTIRAINPQQQKYFQIEFKDYNPNYYWEGRKVISLNHWLKIKNNCGLKVALQYFPNDFPRSGFTFILYGIEDQTLMHEAELWCSDFERLMEYRKNAEYGKTKCLRCLISTDREESGIFIGINKVVSRAIDVDGVPVYPCQVLNRFECPYDTKISKDVVEEGITEKHEVDYLFHLSEIAFAVELALAKAQEEDSLFRIKSVEDVYHVLTNKETFEKVLHQA